MSALPPKADMCGAAGEVRFGPIADIGQLSRGAVGGKRAGPSLKMLLEPPARQRKSSPKEHRAKHRREPSRWPVAGRTSQDAHCPNAKRHTNAKTSKQKDIFQYYHRRLQRPGK